jgi:opacity protein-like surface antigen
LNFKKSENYRSWKSSQKYANIQVETELERFLRITPTRSYPQKRMKQSWFYLTVFLYLFQTVCWAQNKKVFISSKPLPNKGILSANAGLGIAYYTGDLSDGINMSHLGLGPMLEAGLQYRLSEHFSARAGVRLYQISADQKHSRNFSGNLSFRSTNPDFYLGGQADLFAFTREPLFNPYLFAGVGFTRINPKAKLDDQWHQLAPLTTEGIQYNRMPLVITAGMGVRYRINDRWAAGIELTNNFAQSDYLDDVSTYYPDPATLPSDLARRLSDRTPEIGLPAQQPGHIRGNPKQNDSYLFMNFTVQRVIWTKQMAQEKKATRITKKQIP